MSNKMLQNIDVVAYNFVKKFLEKQDEKQLDPPINMKNSLKYILSLESIHETSENED